MHDHYPGTRSHEKSPYHLCFFLLLIYYHPVYWLCVQILAKTRNRSNSSMQVFSVCRVLPEMQKIFENFPSVFKDFLQINDGHRRSSYGVCCSARCTRRFVCLLLLFGCFAFVSLFLVVSVLHLSYLLSFLLFLALHHHFFIFVVLVFLCCNIIFFFCFQQTKARC